MPVSNFAAPAVSMAKSSAPETSPLVRGDVLYMPEDELDDPGLPERVYAHLA